MAPQKQNSAAGNHLVAFGSGGRANGLYQPSSAAMAAAKKPNLQHIQADHELFLQAFESESLLSTNSIFTDISFRVALKSVGSFSQAPRLREESSAGLPAAAPTDFRKERIQLVPM